MESKWNRFYIYRLIINVWGNYIELKQVYKYKMDSISIRSILGKSDSLFQLFGDENKILDSICWGREIEGGYCMGVSYQGVATFVKKKRDVHIYK